MNLFKRIKLRREKKEIKIPLNKDGTINIRMYVKVNGEWIPARIKSEKEK